MGSLENQKVDGVIARTLTRFAVWRGELAVIASRESRSRPYSETERVAMLATCGRVSAESAAAQAELAADLSEAPEGLRKSSRVVDMEKALDGLRSMVEDLQDKLAG